MLHAAAELLRKGGVEAVSTRAVAAKAGVQPPTIYRQFADKDGLLDAVAHFDMQNYLHAKRRLLAQTDDPVQDLRQLWNMHVDFGLTHPHSYKLAFGTRRAGRTTAAAEEALEILRGVVARIGREGRLRMSVKRSTTLITAAGMGVVFHQMPLPEQERDPRLSAIACENAISAVLTDKRRAKSILEDDLPSRAIAVSEALRAAGSTKFTTAEGAVLAEWLDRLAEPD
jgi:AcrR family transcriptional regulator